MFVTVTEFKKNVDKYVQLAHKEEVYITEQDDVLCRIWPPRESAHEEPLDPENPHA